MRVRFLQTSDVHLRADRPERFRSLELVFQEADARAADAVLIVGDLFDRASDAAAGRAFVRELVEHIAPRPVVFLPGNHDPDCYENGADYGANAVLLCEKPYARAIVAGLQVIGIPYQHGRTGAECLTGLTCDARQSVLMAHGTLIDAAPGFAGEGEDGSYMPFTLSEVFERCCYAALGHMHSGQRLLHREGERLAAYAGSPVVTSRRELGPRTALLVDVETGAGVVAHERIPLATPYYERIEVRCSPGDEENAIADLARRAAGLKRPGVRVLARLCGVSTATETALRTTAEKALARAWNHPVGAAAQIAGDPDASGPILELATTSYAELAQVPVVGEFVSRLEACAKADPSADPRVLEAALEIGLHAFLESLP
jgi:DNA repair exonuclease SbcCD nuclease subunit